MSTDLEFENTTFEEGVDSNEEYQTDFGTIGSVGENEIFQTLPDQQPQFLDYDIQGLIEQSGIDFGGIGSVGEAEIFQTFPEEELEVQEPRFIVGPDGQVLPVRDELLAQNFPDQDPLSYDFYSALDQSYRFLNPQDMVPEGIEAVYGPTERDPFRQDWSEAEFRVPVDYEGEFLTGDEMNVVQAAYDFVGSLALEAQDAGYTSTRDYLAAMQEYEPSKYNALANALNSYAGIIDQYGDQYKFQAALHDAEQISVDPMQRNDLIRSSMDLLRDYVAAGIVSREEAAYLAQDPVGLISLIAYGDFTPQSAQVPAPPTETTPATTTQPAPATPETGGETSFSWDDSDNRDAETAVDEVTEEQVDAQTGIETVESVGEEAIQEEDTAGGIAEVDANENTEDNVVRDAEGRTVTYPVWDEDEQYPLVFDGSRFIPPAVAGHSTFFDQTSGREYIVDENGEIVKDITNYPRSPIGDAPDAPADDGITAVDVPVTSEGVYDLSADSQRALSDVADFYTGPEATLNLGEAFRTNFGYSDPIYDESLFTETERPDWYGDYPNLPVVTVFVGNERVMNRRGRYENRAVFEERYLSSPSDAGLVNYEDQSVLEYSDRFDWGGNDSEWLNEKYREFVKTRPHDRPARAFSGERGFGNPWSFDIATEPIVQQSLFEALVDYSDTTGISIDQIHNTQYDDIGAWGRGNNDVFDIEHFMTGSEESGWEGFIPVFQDIAREFGLGTVGSEQDLIGMAELERMAFLSSAVLRPMVRQVNSIIEEREGGFDFDRNVSIPSEYENRFGLRTPDYLSQTLMVGGPDNEVAPIISGTSDVNMAEGGYIGGVAGGMDDTIPASIDGSQPAALSSGEFVVPADVVSHLGDGNNQNGAAKLYNFMDQVRTVKTGSIEQPDPFNDGIMANMIGEPYGQ